MTAITMIKLPDFDCLIAMGDGATYDKAAIIRGIGPKLTPVLHWPGVIAHHGPSIPAAIISKRLINHFESFDGMVAGIEAALRVYAEMYDFDKMGDDTPEFVIGGWSAKRQSFEIYSIAISDRVGGLVGTDCENAIQPEAYRLRMTGGSIISAPSFHGSVASAGDFPGLRAKTSVEATIADLRIAIEVQRQFKANDGNHYVGGFGEIMIVRRNTIEQGILCRWPEDTIGEKIKPAPIDWPTLRARAAEIEFGPHGGS